MYVVEFECMHLNTSGVLFKPFTKGTVEIPKEPMTKHQLPGKLIEGIDNGVEKEGGKCTNAFQSVSQRTGQSQAPFA